jgi:hypothetical protein
MPLEIKELHIKVTVNQPQQGTTENSVSPAQNDKQDEAKEAIINQCIEEVLEIMSNKKER